MSALEGMRILDMTQYEAGPSCTQLLAWLGADVVKIEPRGQGDAGRHLLTPDSNYSNYFCNWNSNKRSVALDLTKPEGRELLFRMLPSYDVFVENYAPGVAEKLGVTYDAMTEVHPDLIYASNKGFGNFGPRAQHKAYDQVVQAAAGAVSITGEADGPPVMPGPTSADSGSGLHLAVGILAAYTQRARTGRGQRVDVSMQEAMLYLMRTMFSFRCDWGRQVVPRFGNIRGAPPTGMYPCKPGGANDFVYLMTITDKHWDSLCATIERLDLIADERFSTSLDRFKNADAIFAEITKWTKERTKQAIQEILGSAGVPCSGVADSVDIHQDSHLQARGFLHELDLPEHGRQTLMGSGVRLSESEIELTRAPLLGEHTDEVLAQDLGISSQELRALREGGVVG